MFGFIFGTVCLVLLIKVLSHGGWHRHRFGRGWLLRRLFRRLDTTPGQEKVISRAVEDLEEAAQGLREELRRSRAEVGRSLRGEHFDGAAVREAFGRQEAAVEGVRRAVTAGLQAIHEALRPEQRAELAELLEHGPRWGHHRCGPRRHAHAAWL